MTALSLYLKADKANLAKHRDLGKLFSPSGPLHSILNL
jgi:hypothetical protein